VCSRVCRGNYCLVDFGGNEQGCGQGVPRLQNFLRISDYLNKLQGQLVCAYYQASTETIVNGWEFNIFLNSQLCGPQFFLIIIVIKNPLIGYGIVENRCSKKFFGYPELT